jgi:Icc-related predicted phosphoesterase
MPNKKIKIAAIGDIHVKSHFKDMYKPLMQELSQKADVLVLCGDLTDLGTAEEAHILADDLRTCRIPVIAVLGNHDYQSDQPEEVKKILRENPHVSILDQEPHVFEGIGFAGVKGFMGGFGSHALGAFGEPLMKEIVKERDREAYALENQLKALATEKKVVLMHYAPIRATVADENADIMPFLGSTRYEQVIDQYDVTVIFHGHANLGPHSGKTTKGTPVFNVALPLLENLKPAKNYLLYEI